MNTTRTVLKRTAPSPVAPRWTQPPNRVTTLSGLQLEYSGPKPRSLLPLALAAMLLWSAVGAALWYLYNH